MAKTEPQAPPVVAIPKPRVDVLERSLLNPFGMPSEPIALREAEYVCHWCNTTLKGGAQLTYYLDAGWEKVKPDYLKTPDAFQFTVSPDGYVTRGIRHEEILMYTTRAHQAKRQAAKTAENMRRMKMTKEEVVQAASDRLGDQAADFLDRHVGPVGSVVDNYERIAVDETQK